MTREIPEDMKSRDPKDQLAYLRRVCGPAAADWLVRYNMHAHALDDLVDDDYHSAMDTAEEKAEARRKRTLNFALNALELFSHPFYRQHAEQLYRLLRVEHLTYEDSLAWEESPVEWQRREADTLRHTASNVARAVVDMCAGMDEARRMSLITRAICYEDHHDKDGKPI